MSGRKSLLDDGKFDNIGRKGSSGAKSDNTDKIKLGVAAGALLLAVVLFAWNFGLLGGGEPEVQSPPMTQEQIKTYEKKKQQIIEDMEEDGGKYGGA